MGCTGEGGEGETRMRQVKGGGTGGGRGVIGVEPREWSRGKVGAEG